MITDTQPTQAAAEKKRGPGRPKKKPDEQPKPEGQTGRIEGIPLDDGNPGAYQPENVQVRIRDADQRTALRRIFHGLNGQSRRLKNGRHVEGYADAVRWLLENVVE